MYLKPFPLDSLTMNEATKEQTSGTNSSAAESQGKTEGQTEAAKATKETAKTETVSRVEYDKLQSDLENFKRIEDERKGKEKKRQEDLLREQGKFKDLYETALKENETMKARLEKLDVVMVGMLDEELKGLPADFDKSLIPAVDPHDQLVWLRKAKVIMVPKVEARRGDRTPPVAADTPLSGMAGIYTHPTSPKH